MFFARLTLEDMMNMVLNITEYQAFSMMMRTKAAQLRWMKQLQEWAKQREKDASTLKLCDSPTKGESKFADEGGAADADEDTGGGAGHK